MIDLRNELIGGTIGLLMVGIVLFGIAGMTP